MESIYSKGEIITGHFNTPGTYPRTEVQQKNEEKYAENESFLITPGKPKTVEVESFSTTLPSFLDSGFETFLIDQGVEILARPI